MLCPPHQAKRVPSCVITEVLKKGPLGGVGNDKAQRENGPLGSYLLRFRSTKKTLSVISYSRIFFDHGYLA
jgi:hypothetical protein